MIRLACWTCDRDDQDGIAPEHLAYLLAHGWSEFAEAGEQVGSQWWTHLATCPNCAREQDAHRRRVKRERRKTMPF